MWFQAIYGKLVQFDDGPILPRFEHQFIGESQNFPGLKYCHSEYFSLGGGDSIDFRIYPWLGLDETNRRSKFLAGAIICQPFLFEHEWYLIAGRIRPRRESGESDSPGRFYTHISFCSKKVGSEGWGNGIFDFPNHIETRPPTEATSSLPLLDIPNIDLELPDNWVDSVVAPITGYLFAGLPSVTTKNMPLNQFYRNCAICLAALPGGTRWQIPFGSGLYYPKETGGSVQFGIWQSVLRRSSDPPLPHDSIFEEYLNQLRRVEGKVRTTSELATWSDQELFPRFSDPLSCLPHKPFKLQASGREVASYCSLPVEGLNACLKTIDDCLVARQLNQWLSHEDTKVRLEDASFNRTELLDSILSQLLDPAKRSHEESIALLRRTRDWDEQWKAVQSAGHTSAQLVAQMVGIRRIEPLHVFEGFEFIESRLHSDTQLLAFANRLSNDLRKSTPNKWPEWAFLAVAIRSSRLGQLWMDSDRNAFRLLEYFAYVRDPLLAPPDSFVGQVAEHRGPYELPQLLEWIDDLESDEADLFCKELKTQIRPVLAEFLKKERAHLGFACLSTKTNFQGEFLHDCAAELWDQHWNQLSGKALDRVLKIFYDRWNLLSDSCKAILYPIIAHCHGHAAVHILFGAGDYPQSFELNLTPNFEKFAIARLNHKNVAKRTVNAVLNHWNVTDVKELLLSAAPGSQSEDPALQFLKAVVERRPVSLTALPKHEFIQRFDIQFRRNNLHPRIEPIVSSVVELNNLCFLISHYHRGATMPMELRHPLPLFQDAYSGKNETQHLLHEAKNRVPWITSVPLIRLLFPNEDLDFESTDYAEMELAVFNSFRQADPDTLLAIYINQWPIHHHEQPNQLLNTLERRWSSLTIDQKCQLCFQLTDFALELKSKEFAAELLGFLLRWDPSVQSIHLIDTSVSWINVLNPFRCYRYLKSRLTLGWIRRESSVGPETKLSYYKRDILACLRALVARIYGPIKAKDKFKVMNEIGMLQKRIPNVPCPRTPYPPVRHQKDSIHFID